MKNKKLFNKIRILSILGWMLATAMILYFACFSYLSYRKELIHTEQEQLLTMAETVGKSLVSFVDQELDSMELYFSLLESGYDINRQEFSRVTQACAAFLEKNQNLYEAMGCFDSQGNLLFSLGDLNYEFESKAQTNHASICGKTLGENGWYEMFLSRQISWGKSGYTLVYAMNLNKLHAKIVAPVKIGKGGYSVVKDSSLSIIMHHAPSQIGMDAIYDRNRLYPQLDLTDLTAWIDLQRSQPAGYGIIQSYVWDDPSLPSEKRIVAYTTIQLPGEEWIVNSTLPFQELNDPLRQMIVRLAAMSLMSLTILGIVVFIMTHSIMREENQKKEINYLKEINEGMVLLRQKDEEIQHYQKIQSIGLMSSHIAHEFNNYLTPVMVYGEILESDSALSPENQELIKGILNSVNQAAGLSRRLLDFSRQDTGIALTVINLTSSITEAADMIRQLAPESIRVETHFPEAPIFVRGRKDMAEHILLNLSNNAFHAMEGTGGTLSLCLSLTEPSSTDNQGQPTALLTVTDTGCGISQEAMDKIFEPFYTTKRSGKGTGLGLSVIRNIMISVGGQIHIDSQPGKGTTFFLYFPVVTEELSQDESYGKKPVKELVIVDDDSALLSSLSSMLKKHPATQNMKIKVFSHPAAFLSRLQKGDLNCDAVLTDYSMPSLNGLELCQLVKKQCPEIRLFLMSGISDNQFDWYVKNQFLEAFILKSELSDRLTELLA